MSAVLEFLLSFRYTLIIFLCLEARFISGQRNNLPEEEKNALLEIADQLGKKDWDFKLNPCDGNSNWNTSKRADMPWYNNSIICDCSYPDGACHVQKIFLKGQDLAGVLPPSLAKLPYLNTIDLTRNFLSGTIPPEWASTKLEYLSVIVNRLSGPIPKYLGNITTLVYMSLESNQFNGTVPAELGKLINLENLILSDNNLTGELPKELNNLTNLTELLSSNRFSGNIPSFLSWTQLQMLEMQASGFEGPIHSSISVLKNLTELRISDLNGGASTFPLLRDMTRMNKLMLRSCNLSGEIPGYLKNMPALKILDLSFNSLTGEIPDLEGLNNLQNTYLTQNFLTGSVPEWMKNRDTRYQFDLSYNNFTETSVPSTCRETLNLFKGYNEGKTLELDKCLRSSPCSKDWYSFHVNCGGGGIKIGDTFFDGDEESSGPAKFVHSGENWGASNTGDFWGRNSSMSEYVANNISTLRVNDSGLYTTARLSPISLTYYGRCLANGNYTVKLHFAEIVFRDNRSFQSLGRRMFDVYIQGEQKLKDFDIEKEANGVDKTVIQTFKTTVINKTLEIRFHYAGKGSTAVPNRGTYGPMISAISVKSGNFYHVNFPVHRRNYKISVCVILYSCDVDFKPPSNKRKKILIGTGAALLALFLILLVARFFWWKHRSNKISREQELRGLDLRTGFFTFRQIKAATNNFNSENKIGEGGFGSVYKGTLLDGTVIAVKQLSSKSKQGNHEFVNEVGIISGLHHPNLVKLYGCCIEGNQLLLVYEYMENNSLARALFGPEEWQLDMNWLTRRKICIGIAKGLAFLHEESTLKVVHRDIKANNVLLDKDLNPKISDFGLAKLEEDDNTHIITRVAGTIGYMAPEYALWGHLTYKADVYSFGIVTLELVAGMNNTRFRPSDGYFCLLDWALVLQKRGKLMELVDPRLLPDLDVEETEKLIRIALLCTSPSPALRPTMSEVVSMLQGNVSIQEFNMDPSIYSSELKLNALREKYEYNDSSATVTLVHSNVTEENGSARKCP
ncbi:probable LRR receptor-like serine/threonine-protein kinase At1g07650 isoform X2 [Primulina huaijiensis]|uniref:probable LRR receptor-like serine/threonine-protein kinase At1g07650 isoform X2 n=1 Tax=Primulina huaijiensis TaxID=1492673 RepID=UPI003CC7018F